MKAQCPGRHVALGNGAPAGDETDIFGGVEITRTTHARDVTAAGWQVTPRDPV